MENKMTKNLCIGDTVWVIARDGSEVPCGVEEKMFISSVKNIVLTTDFDLDVDSTLDGFVESTQFCVDTEIEAYPVSDCYLTKEEAEKALDEEFEKEEAMAYADLEDLESSYI